MRLLFVLILTYFLFGVGVARAQASDSTRQHFIRAGVEHGLFRRTRYSNAADPEPRRLSILFPTYVGLWGHQYLNLDLPSLYLSKEDSLRIVGLGLVLSYGYAALTPGSRVRPYAVMDASASVSWITNGQGLNLGSHQYVLGTLLLYPRLGVMGKVAGPIWLDLSLPAPGGFSLLDMRLVSNAPHTARLLSRTAKSIVPALQLGVLYQF